MSKLDRNLLSVALSSALLMLAAGAHAQSTTSQTTAPVAQDGSAVDLDTVRVTGIRRGIESAIATKRDATSIVESVSAEDIGKLPDVSIAESIARLPGLSAQRVAGRAQVISVRGLSPDFATTLLNGREMVSTGDNRSVEFDQYPSELVSGVTVYKTPDAALVGQGLSGTLDMQTVRPLNFAEPVVTLSGRYQRNSLGEAADTDPYGNRISASWIWQSADRRFGVSIGASHSDTPIQENQVGLYEPWKTDARPGLADGTWATDGMKALRRTGYTKRDGVMATLQFRPSNTWTSTLDAFHSRAEQEDTANQWEVNTQYNGSFPCDPACVYSDVRTSENGSFAGGTLTGVYPLVRGMYNRREDRISALGWSNEFNLERVRLTTDLHWSKARRSEISLENNAQRLPNPSLDTIALDIRRDGFSQMVPTLDYSDPTRLFLTNTIYGSGYGKTPEVEDELKGARIGLTVPAPAAIGWLADIDLGLNHTDREKSKRQPEGNIILGAQGDTAIAADLQYGLVDLGFAGVGYIPAWNVPAAVARYMSFEPTEDLDYLIPKAWTVSEDITTAFARANISADWGGTAVTGNVGVQIQRVDQSSASNYWDATQPAGSNVQPFESGKTYTDVLPSMNLAFQFENEHTLRVGLAEQVARPRVDQLRSSLEFGVDDQGRPGGSGGNPLLDPWRAYAFDVSWEKYFGNRAYVAAAFFYKDLRTYIYTETRDGYDFSALLANYVPRPGASPITQTTGNFTAPQNAEGGTLRGLELTASLPLDLWTDALRGFGIVASASFNDSSIQILDPESANSVGSDPIDLPGLSRRVYNLTAYFERDGFEARVSQRRRSDFIGEIGNFDGARTLRYVVGENITDAQISYTFGDGASLDGLTLLLQANNLTNATYRTYAGTRDRPLENVEWGRTFLVGLNYRF